LRNATSVIAISEFTRNDILSYYKITPEKIVTIYNFFNFNKYDVSENDNVGIHIDRPFILNVSSLAKHKNITAILMAFNEICKKGLDYMLIFVGSLKSMYREAKKYYKSLDESVRKNIVFLEKISNASLAYLYKNCSIFISSTLFEGLGMPIVEALYFNAPTLVSAIEVCREVTLNKVLYFDPTSFEEIIQILEKHNYNVPKPNIQNEVIEMFSEKNTSQKYIDIVNRI
jgi:glycosyltransferase involved in cell wall biosynthesis